MATSFSALKKARSESFDKLNKQLQNMNGNKSNNNDDDKYWKPEVDKAGNGYAVIRFLPAPEGEDLDFVKLHDHGFQGPGGWYIEKSLTTIGMEDPAGEFNSKLWNASTDDNSPERQQARKQKRRTSFHANIYIVKDPANPSNEGKVFLFKFGKKIFDKLNDMMNPQFADEKPVNPFDLWEGADFKLKIRNVEGYRNYDKSEFSEAGPITSPKGAALSDEQMEEIWKTAHSLQEIVDPKNFKSYDELKAKLYKVLGLDGGSHAPMNKSAGRRDDDQEMEQAPRYKERQAPKMEEASSPSLSGDDDDETLDFFKSLAKDD